MPDGASGRNITIVFFHYFFPKCQTDPDSFIFMMVRSFHTPATPFTLAWPLVQGNDRIQRIADLAVQADLIDGHPHIEVAIADFHKYPQEIFLIEISSQPGLFKI